MVSNDELARLSKLLNPEIEQEQMFTPMDQSQLTELSQKNNTPEPVQTVEANNIVEAENAPEVDRQIASKPVDERQMMLQKYQDT